MLLRLSAEVLQLIIEQVLLDCGIRWTISVRRVCRIVNGHVLDAIYALPTFTEYADQQPQHLQRDRRMHKSLIHGLVATKFAKYQAQPQRSPALLREISRTVALLQNLEANPSVDALSALTVEYIPLDEIVRGLSKIPHRSPQSTPLLENALAYALSQGHDIQNLLELGATAQVSTNWFGDVLEIAAKHASPADFRLVLNRALDGNDTYTKTYVFARLILALAHAAAQGKTHMFTMDWCSILKPLPSQCTLTAITEPAMRKAVLNNHWDTFKEIFQLCPQDVKMHPTSSQVQFWIDVLRVASCNGSYRIVKCILEETAVVRFPQTLTFPFEDACRAGHLRIVRLIMNNETRDNLHTYAGALHWAARRGYRDILSVISDRHKMWAERMPCGDVTSCCRSAHEPLTLLAMYESICIENPQGLEHALDQETFTQIMDAILSKSEPEWARGVVCPRTQQSCIPVTPELPILVQLLSEEALKFNHACARGDFLTVHAMIQHAQETDQWFNTGGGFSSAIRYNQPALLQYLCETLPTKRYFVTGALSSNPSTAILNIALENGWDPNKDSSTKCSPTLGVMSGSDEMTRWFLDNGADPNARHDWDITSLSAAVNKSSLVAIDLMLERGGDVRRGQLLYWAITRDSPDQLGLIEFLITLGAPLNAQIYEDDPVSWVENKLYGIGTPLHWAVQCGNIDVVTFLLRAGANIGTLDSHNRTVLDIAQEEWREDIANLIIEFQYSRKDDG